MATSATWWQVYAIDLLPEAARLWAMTHVPEGAEAGIEDETVSTHPKLDGRRVSNTARLPVPLQNDETNPILRPEANELVPRTRGQLDTTASQSIALAATLAFIGELM